jgi:hypothetical protein
MHFPLLHVMLVVVQFVHAPPDRPQALLAVPGAHV